VTKAVRPLLAAGLLIERTSTAVQIGAGRPVQIVEVVADRHTFAGVKVTAERAVGVCTGLRGQILAEHEVGLAQRTDLSEPAPHVPVDALVEAVRACVAELSSGRAAAALGWRYPVTWIAPLAGWCSPRCSAGATSTSRP
jgi:hypothetical protein